MLELVAQAGSLGGEDNNEQVLRLYARWLEIGDPTLALKLRRLGVALHGRRGH